MVKLHRPDAAFGQAFLIQLAVILFGAGKVIIPAVLAQVRRTETEQESPKIRKRESPWNYILLIFEVAIATLMSCSLVLVIMMRYTEIIIPFCYWGVPAFFACLSLYSGFTYGFNDIFWTLVFSMIVLFLTWLSYSRARKHVDFAASTLEVSIVALSPSVVLLAFLASILIGVWLIIWCFGVYGILGSYVWHDRSLEQWFTSRILFAKSSPDGSAIVPTTVFICFLSLYWTAQVINNLVHTTTAQTVVAWWWNDKLSMFGALQTCCTSLLGPVCKGSLVVAAVQALDTTVSFLFGKEDRRRNGNIGVDISQVIIRLVARLVEYINYWTFVVLAVHVDHDSHRSLSYADSGKRFKEFSQRRGWSSFLSDRLVYSALWFCRLFVALLTTSIVYGVESIRHEQKDGWPGLAGTIAFVSSYMIASASLFCIESAVRTVIICFGEFPERLQSTHREEYNKLEKGWSKAYPVAWSEQNRRSKCRTSN